MEQLRARNLYCRVLRNGQTYWLVATVHPLPEARGQRISVAMTIHLTSKDINNGSGADLKVGTGNEEVD